MRFWVVPTLAISVFGTRQPAAAQPENPPAGLQWHPGLTQARVSTCRHYYYCNASCQAAFCYSCMVTKTSYRDAVCSQVAKLLRVERERQAISMTRLAEMSGLSQGMISLVEHEHRNPSLETLLRMSQALKIELSTVLTRAERIVKKLDPE